MTGVLVIGYGNTLRGDDALGWHVADRLRKSPPPDTEVIASHQLTPEMAEAISEAGRVVFIDAREDTAPGQIQVERLDPAQSGQAAFSHQCNPWGLLQSARVLYGSAPIALLVGVGGGNFDLGDQMSPVMIRALEETVALVTALATDARHPHWLQTEQKGDTDHA